MILPYRRCWTKVNHKHNIPINALYACNFVNFLMSFIYLGSETGFNIIIDSANIFYSLGFVPLLAASLLYPPAVSLRGPEVILQDGLRNGDCL
jgi:hypothetical protein